VPWLATALAIVGSSVALLIAWYRNDWDLEAAAWSGDAAAPLVGIASLAAVGAALWSVYQQSEALDVQTKMLETQQEEMRTQKESFAKELKAQHDALEVQKQALDEERKYRRHSALRDAYGTFFTALDHYRESVKAYATWLDKKGHREDGFTRSQEQNLRKPLHTALQAARWVVNLADPVRERYALRAKLTERIELEPPRVDDQQNQRGHVKTLRDALLHQHVAIVDLRKSLSLELGLPYEDAETESGE
jgi:hypothetical protein